QASAWEPPGVTPEHWAMKSERQADLTALRCACVGWDVCVPVVAAPDCAGAVAGVAAGGTGLDFLLVVSTGDTALRQAGESVALCCCRQVSASMPPGVTPEHCAMKSERQADLMALRCASVGCCA